MQRIIVVLISAFFITSCGSGNDVSKTKMENGKKVYEQYCQSCHMDDGGGVPRMNAPLTDSKYITGDKNVLINIALHGSAALTEKKYQNTMPSQAHLSDEELANVLTYIRNSFNNKAPAIAPEDVKAIREKTN